MCAHLKRYMNPNTWKIPVKANYWSVRPSPGPHPLKQSMPLLMIVRDILKYADTGKEAKSIINSGKVLIDGKPVKNYKWPVGFMDVISIPDDGIHYRMLLDLHGRFKPITIPEENSGWKLLKINNKTTLKGGLTQLNFHDGRNLITTDKTLKTGDVIKFNLEDGEINDVYKFQKENIAYITGGKHSGKISHIEDFEERGLYRKKIVKFKGFETIKDYVFMIGDEEAVIVIPEVN